MTSETTPLLVAVEGAALHTLHLGALAGARALMPFGQVLISDCMLLGRWDSKEGKGARESNRRGKDRSSQFRATSYAPAASR